MSFLSKIQSNFTRSVGDFLWNNLLSSYAGTSWKSKGTWGTQCNYSSTSIAESDNKITPQLLVEVCRSQVIFGIKNTIRLRLKEKPYFFKGGKRSSKVLLDILENVDYDKFVDNWIEAMIGTGGGNALCFIRDGKFVCEPFNTEGRTRVRVYADQDQRQIIKYDVVNSSQSVILTLNSDKVHHERYSEEGDFRFAINPVVVATRYYLLGKKAFAALENGFISIRDAKRFVSPNLGFFKDISDLAKDEFITGWIDFKETFSSLTGYVASPLPMSFTNTSQTTAEMQTREIIQYIDEVMVGAYSASLSILGRSDGVNYANGEQNADNFYQLAVEPIKARIEQITTKLMSDLIFDYDPVVNPFKFCKEYSEEDIALREQALVTLKDITPAIQGLGFQIKKESVANLLSKFGLELEDTAQVIDVQAKDDVTQDDKEVEVETKRAEKKQYGCVMAMIEPKTIEKLQSKINKEDLYSEPVNGSGVKDGLGKNPHITVLYGLEYEVSIEEVKESLDESMQDLMDIEKTSRGLGVFSQTDKPYDVLIIKIKKQNDLLSARKALMLLPHTLTYSDYQPHITLAYLKKGTAQKYIDLLDSLDIDKFKITDVVFSSAEQDLDYTSLTKTQNRDFFQRAIKKDQIKGIDSLNEDKEISESKKKLFKAIENQINDAELTFEDQTRELKSIKPIESYLNQDGFKKIAKRVLRSSLGIYNYNYGTDYTLDNVPSFLTEYSELFAKITLYGWEGVKTNNYSDKAVEMVNIPKDYKGIDTTTKNQLNNKTENFDKKEFIQNRQQTIWEGLKENVFDNAQAEMADLDGRIWVGVITSRDDRVGEDHRPLDNKYQKKGKMPDPKTRRGCRCIKYFGQSEKEMIDLGFSLYRN